LVSTTRAERKPIAPSRLLDVVVLSFVHSSPASEDELVAGVGELLDVDATFVVVVAVVDLLVLVVAQIVAGLDLGLDVELLDLLAPPLLDGFGVNLGLCAGAVGDDPPL
jgi:hypothetical protein